MGNALRTTQDNGANPEKASDELQLPGLGLPVNYLPANTWRHNARFPVLLGADRYNDDGCFKTVTLTRREVCMMRMIEEITNKPEWWRKVKDEAITEKWKKEALENDWNSLIKFGKFTPAMADACIAELRKKAELYEETGLIPIMDFSLCAVKSDRLMSGNDGEELLNLLKAGVARLENVPEDEKDWHPRSGEKVLDLVHPSLYPLEYGRTRVVKDKRLTLDNALAYSGSGTVIPKPENMTDWRFSNRFQWLPCDVAITETHAKIESYINNLHPVDHADLYLVIERFIEKSLPAWDLIYRWGMEELPAVTRISCSSVLPECEAPEACEESDYGCQPCNRPLEEGEAPRRSDSEVDEDWYEGSEREEKDLPWFEQTHPLEIPEPDTEAGYFELTSNDVNTSGFFSDANRIQVIAKLANIHLTPDNPSYEGGSWHVEGQLNEHICATALFYYDNENITDSRLDFQTNGNSEDLMMELRYEQSDFVSIERAFAMNPNGNIRQTVGSVLTCSGRALFFPNLYEHHVSPFKLVDPTRPGHRKILALFLVDPAIPIISTANVPPQQREWFGREAPFRGTNFEKLPPELQNIVLTDDALPQSLEAAKAAREELMDERSANNDKGQHYVPEWNFCEH